MTLSLITPEKEILKELEVTEVLVPGKTGELGILPGHAPLVSTLTTGTLKYYTKSIPKGTTVQIHWGYCEVRPNKIIILAEAVGNSEKE